MADQLSSEVKSLFVCCTPLQAVLAGRIIESKRLPREKCVLFFYSSFDNDKYRRAFEQLRLRCGDSTFYLWKPDFPRYILEAKRYFRQHACDAVYAASIDSVFVQLAMSMRRDVKVFTFDDGAANVVRSDVYHYDHGHSPLRRFAFWLLGNRYDANRVKRESRMHYTIFPGVPNIVSKVEYVSLFDPIRETAGANGRCSVVLGTVFREILPPQRLEAVLGSATAVVDAINGEVFFIPHPRDMDVSMGRARVIESADVAEAIMQRLLESYSYVDVLGFGSTTQINLASSPRVRNFFFTWSGEPTWMREVRQRESAISGRPPNLIDLS